MAKDQSGFHGFMKKIEVIGSVRSFMLHSSTYVEDDGIKHCSPLEAILLVCHEKRLEC